MDTVEGLTIRDMRMEDLDAVMRIEIETFETPWSVDYFRRVLQRGERSVYLVAEASGVTLGYLGADVQGSEAHITNMAVETGCRGSGLGSALLEFFTSRCRSMGVRRLTLEVREKNMDARDFYCRFGFRTVGFQVGYYTDTGEDAILMATGDILSDEYERLSGRRPGEAKG